VPKQQLQAFFSIYIDGIHLCACSINQSLTKQPKGLNNRMEDQNEFI